MRQLLAVSLAVQVLVATLRAADEPPDKGKTPGERFQALFEEYYKATQQFKAEGRASRREPCPGRQMMNTALTRLSQAHSGRRAVRAFGSSQSCGLGCCLPSSEQLPGPPVLAHDLNHQVAL
jgi:hypothetical protein